MVKRKAAKKAAKKTAKKKAAKKSAAFDGARAWKRAAKTASAKPRRKSEEQIDLMPGVRYTDLDRYCRNIGDNRDDVNQLKGEGKTIETGALKAMRVHGVKHYKNAGVSLSIEPGDEKLVVRRDRDGSADGGQVDPPKGDAGKPETGEGQDPGKIGEALTEGDGDE